MTQTVHSEVTIQIADLQYLQSTVLQGIPVDYNKPEAP